MMSAASPGAKCSSRKFSAAMPRTTGTTCNKRLRTNQSFAGIAAHFGEDMRLVLPHAGPARIHRDAICDQAVNSLVPHVSIGQLDEENDRQLIVQDLLDLVELL